jgi:hypothetical protein
LYVKPGEPLPRLLTLEQWASQQEFNSLWAGGEEHD